MKSFPNYRVVQKGSYFLVEKETSKDRWISILEIFARLLIFFSGLWICIMILLKVYFGIIMIILSPIIYSMFSDLMKFKSLEQAKGYIEKKYDKYKDKQHKSVKYYSTTIKDDRVILKEYTDQEIRKEKLLNLK